MTVATPLRLARTGLQATDSTTVLAWTPPDPPGFPGPLRRGIDEPV
jgi:hypothetical protein